MICLLVLAAGCSFTSLDGFSEPTNGGTSDGGPPANDAAVDGSSADDGSAGGSDATNGSDSSTSCTTIPNLVGWWTFDQSSVSGTTVADRGTSAPNGTMMGSTTFTGAIGKVGDALQFPPNTAGWIGVADVDFDYAAGASNTFSFWFHRAGGDVVDDSLLMAPSSPRYDLWLVNEAGKDFLCINTQSYDCWGFQDDNLRDRWVHVVAVLVNGAITQGSLYIDGAKRPLTCRTEGGFQPCTAERTIDTPVTFGGESDYPFKGKMDDMRIYKRALTDAEVKAIFEGRVCP